jgi:hypothetical protein
MGAAVGSPVGMVAKTVQGGDVAVGDQPQRTARTAVASVRTTFGDVRLPAERHHSGAPVTCLDVDLGFVDESGHE